MNQKNDSTLAEHENHGRIFLRSVLWPRRLPVIIVPPGSRALLDLEPPTQSRSRSRWGLNERRDAAKGSTLRLWIQLLVEHRCEQQLFSAGVLYEVNDSTVFWPI